MPESKPMLDTPYTTRELLMEYDWFHDEWGMTSIQIAERLGIKVDSLQTTLRRHGGDRWPCAHCAPQQD